MDAGLKQRLIGAAVLVALAVIFLPMLVKGPAPDSGVSDLSMRMPDAPEGGYRTVDLPLVVPADAPEGGVLGAPQPLEDGQLPTVDTATAPPAEGVVDDGTGGEEDVPPHPDAADLAPDPGARTAAAPAQAAVPAAAEGAVDIDAVRAQAQRRDRLGGEHRDMRSMVGPLIRRHPGQKPSASRKASGMPASACSSR